MQTNIAATKACLRRRRDNYMHRSTFAYPADVQSVARQPTDPNMYWVEHALDGRIVRFHAYADECEDVGRAIDHQGWYCDGDSGYLYGLMRGAVFLLTHGRYVAGYVHGESRRKGFTEVTGLNGATIDLHNTFDNARDAALMADEHARIAAEREREYQEQCEAEQREADELETMQALCDLTA